MTKENEQQIRQGLFLRLPIRLRRFLTVLLALGSLAKLTACGSEEAPPPAVVVEAHTPTTATTGPDSTIPTVEIAKPMATATAVLNETEIVSARYFEKIYTLTNGKTLTIKIPDNIGYGNTNLPGEPGLVNATIDRAANLILTRYSIEENSTILIDLRTNTQTNQPELTHALSAVLLDGQIKDEITKQVYSQPISVVFAGMETDLRDSMPLGWKNMVAVVRPSDNHLLMYQQVGGNWQLAGVVSAENGVFYKYDPVIKTLTNTVDNSVIDIDPNTLRTTAGNGGLTIAFSQPDLEPSAQTVESRALNYLEVIKTKFDVKNAHFTTIGPRFLSGRVQSNIWQLSKGELKTLDSGITYNARGDNFVYVVQTTEDNIEVLELKTPFESTLQNVRGADGQLTFALNQNAYYFEATTVGGKLVVRAIPFSNLNSEEGPKDSVFVLREGVWVVEVEESINIEESLRIREDYTPVISTTTTSGVRMQILGSNDYNLPQGSITHRELGDVGAADVLHAAMEATINERPITVYNLGPFIERLKNMTPEEIRALVGRDGAIIISGLDLENAITTYTGENFADTDEVIYINQPMQSPNQRTVAETDRYLELDLEINGEVVKLRLSHLYGFVGHYNSEVYLNTKSGLIYTDPKGEQILVLFSGSDEKDSRNGVTQFNIFTGSLSTLIHLTNCNTSTISSMEVGNPTSRGDNSSENSRKVSIDIVNMFIEETIFWKP